MKTEVNTITINGVEYVRADADSVQAPKPNGNRCIVVVDRGWIFAGDVQPNGDYLILTRAVWVFRWEKIGFDGVIANPEKAEIRKLDNDVIVPKRSEIFSIPVHDDWGL